MAVVEVIILEITVWSLPSIHSMSNFLYTWYQTFIHTMPVLVSMSMSTCWTWYSKPHACAWQRNWETGEGNEGGRWGEEDEGRATSGSQSWKQMWFQLPLKRSSVFCRWSLSDQCVSVWPGVGLGWGYSMPMVCVCVCVCVCVRGMGYNGCTMSVIPQRVSDQMPSSSVYGMLKLDSLTEFFRWLSG